VVLLAVVAAMATARSPRGVPSERSIPSERTVPSDRPAVRKGPKR
jgi:hypothetical protein